MEQSPKPEQQTDERERLREIREGIDLIDDNIFSAIAFGINNGMEKEEILRKVPISIHEVYEKFEETNQSYSRDESFDWLAILGEEVKNESEKSAQPPEGIPYIAAGGDTKTNTQSAIALWVYERAKLALEAGLMKWELGEEVLNAQREDEIKQRARNFAEDINRDPDTYQSIIERIINLCRELQGRQIGIWGYEESIKYKQ